VNIVLAGDGPLPALLYPELLAAGYQVTAACYSGDGEFSILAERDGLPFMYVDMLANPRIAVPFLRAANADLLILANVTVLLPEAVFTTPRFGTICFHPSLLPRHRGKHAVRDTINAGDMETGISVFQVDTGIDTGKVLTRRRCPVPAGISSGGLYYRHLVPLGVGAILEAVDIALAPALHEAVT